jgi:C4-dicarboxylate-specific signal transduction histidine kinase
VDSIEGVAEPEKMALGPGKEETLRQRQLALIGKVIAGFSDKIEGHLTDIQESTGRLGDLVGQASESTQEDRETFAGILSTIERHVKILAQKKQHLNRFAQRTGALSSTFDAGELIEETLSFSTRSARLRRVSLAQEAAKMSPSLRSDPMRIHFLVSILVDSMLERVSRGGKVILRAESAEEGVVIEVEGHGTVDPESPSLSEKGNPYWPVVEQVVCDLGGRLQMNASANDINRTALFLPTKQVPDTS